MNLLDGCGHIMLQHPSHQHTTGATFSYDRRSISGMMRSDAPPRVRVSAQNALRETTGRPDVLSYDACPVGGKLPCWGKPYGRD